MSQSPPPNFYPPMTDNIHPELQTHLRLLYDRAQNHFAAIGNLTTKINALQAQIDAMTK